MPPPAGVEEHDEPAPILPEDLPSDIALSDGNGAVLRRLPEDGFDIPIDLGQDVVEPVPMEVLEDLRRLHPPITDIDPFPDTEGVRQALAHRDDGGVVGGVARI